MVQSLADIVDSSADVTTNFRAELEAFNAFQVLGLIGSVISLIAARFSSVPRQATWYNFMISWVVFCTSYLLLFFAGQAYNPSPSLALCVAQSSLTYSVAPFAAGATLALVVQLFFNIQTTLSGRAIKGQRYWRIFILIMPYMVFVGVLIESIAFSLADPEAKFSSVSYCSLENHVPGRITAALVVMLLVPMPILNIILYIRLRKRDPGTFKSLFVRVSIFTLFGVIAVVTGLLFFLIAFINHSNSNSGLVELDLVLAIIPVAAVLIFGTHKDLLEVWGKLFVILYYGKKKTSFANVQPMKKQYPKALEVTRSVDIERF